MGILRSEDFLITTWVGEVSRKIIWNGDETQDLDYPMGWVIERHGDKKLRIRDASLAPLSAQLADAVEFDVPDEGGRQLVELPAPKAKGPHRALDVEVMHMKQPDPVYLMRHVLAPRYPGQTPKQLMQFYGERYYLVRYRPVPSTRVVDDGQQPIFKYTRIPTGYEITALAHGLRIKNASDKINIPLRARAELTEQAFFSSTIIYGVHWWRYRMVPTPDSSPPIETEETEDDIREDNRFTYSALVFLAAFTVALYTMWNKSLHEKPEPKIIANVEIKAPKIIPPTKEELKPKPPPPPPPPEPEPVKPPEPPKVVEVKPEPPKVEPPKPEPPKPKPPKVAKKKPPKVPKVAKVKPPPPPPKEPPPKTPEPPPPPVKVAKPPEQPPSNAGNVAAQKAKEAEAMKQQLAKSLGFLSTSSKRAAKDPTKYEQKEGRFTETPTLGGDVSKSTSLDKVIKDAPGDGNIRTNSSRTVSSTVDFGPKKGKGLNDVQGKVSLGEIYQQSGNLGDSMGGASLSVSGLGAVSEGEIEKALQKYVQRFQFCYEKALLSDSSLGGKIVMQWTIGTTGKGKSPKVLSSQMNNKDLHNCISKVLTEIPFPKPKGGTVEVKKTFAFSSSSL
jgi:hypothetical protein